MAYIGGDTIEPGCIFCNRLAAHDDIASLILHRGERSFAIMNLFPYNTGHLMIVPNDHVATFDAISAEALAEMTALLPPLTRALRRVLNPAGFNIGMNIGDVAGAGVAAHLHQHLVPRWLGDANFMPILASTMVVPELIPVTYAKIRAELRRELNPTGADLTLVPFNDDRRQVLMHAGRDGGALLAVAPRENQALWRTGLDLLRAAGALVKVDGWASDEAASTGARSAIAYSVQRASPESMSGSRWLDVNDALQALSAPDQDLIRAAVQHESPPVTAPPGPERL
jgi:ATP adenylyltransferase